MCESKVFDFLNRCNRPYSQNDIQANLKDFGKTAIVKALASLVEANKVVEKVYGKQKIYFVNQDLFAIADDEEMKELQAKVQSNVNEIGCLTKMLKEKDDKLKKIQTVPEKKDLEDQMAKVEKEIKSLQSMISSNVHVPVPPEEFRKVKADHMKLTRELRKRKEVVQDSIDCILEAGFFNGNKAALIEELNLNM